MKDEDVEKIRAQCRAHYWGEEYRNAASFEEAQAIYRREQTARERNARRERERLGIYAAYPIKVK